MPFVHLGHSYSHLWMCFWHRLWNFLPTSCPAFLRAVTDTLTHSPGRQSRWCPQPFWVWRDTIQGPRVGCLTRKSRSSGLGCHGYADAFCRRVWDVGGRVRKCGGRGGKNCSERWWRSKERAWIDVKNRHRCCRCGTETLASSVLKVGVSFVR